MKKIFTSIFAVAAMTVCAQQLPNVGFENNWVDNYPWNSVSGWELSMRQAAATMDESILADETYGIQPEGWVISNVAGVVSEKEPEYGGGWGALGATLVGTRVEGKNGGYAVCLTNNPNPFMATQVVPGYITLGTSWATNTLDWMTFSPANKDGGVFGGMAFTYRPDALVFDYKINLAESENEHAFTMLAYSWKGTWTQADVPGNNSMSAETVKVTMIDRDRNILGMQTAQGGEITKTDDAALIAKGYQLLHPAASSTDWEVFTLPLEYFSDANPEKVNIVIGANNVYEDVPVINGDAIVIDNVRFVYYSRLASLSVNGAAIEGFDSNKYEYILNINCPDNAEAISAELMKSASNPEYTVELNKETATATVTVTNNSGADVDDLDAHTYTIKFAGASAETETIGGVLSIFMLGDFIAQDQPATLEFTSTGANTCTITLPNFMLDLGGGPAPLGDIVVTGVNIAEAGGVKTYTGRVEGMQLLDGQLVADVDLTGTVDASGKADFKISVLWSGISIDVTFTGQTSGIASVEAELNAPVEYYNVNGVRVSEENLTSGLYIRRQGNKVQKVIVK